MALQTYQSNRSQGYHGQGKAILFKVGKKSKNFVSGQGISKFLIKLSEKSGNFFLRLPQIILLDVFTLVKVILF